MITSKDLINFKDYVISMNRHYIKDDDTMFTIDAQTFLDLGGTPRQLDDKQLFEEARIFLQK